MKKILTVYTGGTICCAPDGEKRNLDPILAKRALLADFSQSSSPFAGLSRDLFEDSFFEEKNQTLSENMTPAKLSHIINHIKSFDFSNFSGIIVMHGTDTLAFTASLFSFVLCDIKIPVMLVSGDRPPIDQKSNAGANFRCAVELILNGIAPNVYVPYRNSDGNIYLHFGNRLMQCTNFSDDFFSAPFRKGFSVSGGRLCETDNKKCADVSLARRCNAYFGQKTLVVSDKVLLINPYTGLDYSRILLNGLKAVVHGTYHSGTVCVERNTPSGDYSTFSILHFVKECDKKGVPLFIAPCKLGSDQYSSAFDLSANSNAVILNMTSESAYAKVLFGISQKLCGDNLIQFMSHEICGEIID